MSDMGTMTQGTRGATCSKKCKRYVTKNWCRSIPPILRILNLSKEGKKSLFPRLFTVFQYFVKFPKHRHSERKYTRSSLLCKNQVIRSSIRLRRLRTMNDPNHLHSMKVNEPTQEILCYRSLRVRRLLVDWCPRTSTTHSHEM